jgi:endonuclease/exonuclease/phosphatase (EEP) superfamily protein YafD
LAPKTSSFQEEKTTLRRYVGKALFFIVSIFSLAFVALAVLTLFGSACRELELLTHLRVQLLLPLLVVVPVLLSFRSKIILILVAVAICIHLFDIIPLYLPHPASVPDATVSILTMNVNSWNKDFSGVQKFIENDGADIVFIQELSPAMGDSLKANLSRYPYKIVEGREGNFGIGTFSKFELLDKQELKLCPDDILTLCATINVHGTKIRLINTHPIAPLNDLYYVWRNQQLDALADLASQSNDATVLVGDLNVSYFSPFLKRLLKRGQLSDSEFGFGVQPSWSAQWWPLHAPFDCVLFRLPLDHVLTKGPIVTLERRLLGDIGSDHLPLSVKLGLTEAKTALLPIRSHLPTYSQPAGPAR